MLTNKNSWPKISNPLTLHKKTSSNAQKCQTYCCPSPLHCARWPWQFSEFFHFNFRCGNLKRSLGKFCSCSNLSMPDKIYTYDNCLTLVFKSDGSNAGLGFLAKYTTTDNNVTRLDPNNNCRYVQLTWLAQCLLHYWRSCCVYLLLGGIVLYLY